MGGPGSGGTRVGSGRKPKTATEKVLHGTASAADREAADRGSGPLLPVACPEDLSAQQRRVWSELAPHALAERTLTDVTRLAFRELCEAIVLKRSLMLQIFAEGLTIETPLGPKAHPLLTQYRGLMQRTEAAMLRFRLSPMGKPLLDDPKPETDGFDDFDRDDDDDSVN